jgi:hypothetical protein
VTLLIVKPPAIPRTQPTFDPGCFVYAKPPVNVRLDAAKNPMVGVELGRQATLYAGLKPWVNYRQYTAPPTEVPGEQPLVPCRLMRDDWNGTVPTWGKDVERVAAAGLPIPDGWVPNTGTDHEGTFLQRDVPLRDGRVVDTYYEAWLMRPNTGVDAGAFPWVVGWCGRAVDCARSPGHYRWNSTGSPSDPLSAWQSPYEGVTATSIFMRDTQLTLPDLRRGYCDHALNFTVMQSMWRSPARWPAQRTDGAYSVPVEEGMRLFLPAGYQVPGGLHPVGECVVRSMILSGPRGQGGWGLVVVDQGGSLGIRAVPGVEAFWAAGTPVYALLAGVPWQDIIVAAEGSDSAPNPV